MGRDTSIDWLPHYREVLVATAVRTVRDSLSVVQAFAGERRAWVAQYADQAGWREAAIAAGAIPDQAIVR
jgi:hypothetical protein